ncbi:MAG: DUF1569 domain-containing protein [Hymenobacteraceae bacterium]|nr:DUF1569 domain-containing protein [Hymenobacteraceae bacterium]
MLASPSFLDPATFTALSMRLEALTPNTPRQWGTMSAHQMLVHCADQVRVSTGRKPLTSLRIPRFLRPFLKWLFITRTNGFKKNMRTMKELDANAAMTTLANFAADRFTLLALLDPAAYAGQAGVDHPLFGYLPTAEFGRITWQHLDHHLRQFGV